MSSKNLRTACMYILFMLVIACVMIQTFLAIFFPVLILARDHYHLSSAWGASGLAIGGLIALSTTLCVLFLLGKPRSVGYSNGRIYTSLIIFAAFIIEIPQYLGLFIQCAGIASTLTGVLIWLWFPQTRLIKSAPKRCLSCTYYDNNELLPCSVEPMHYLVMQNSFTGTSSCQSYETPSFKG